MSVLICAITNRLFRVIWGYELVSIFVLNVMQDVWVKNATFDENLC